MLKTRILTAVVLLMVILPVMFLNNMPALMGVSALFCVCACWEHFRLCKYRFPKVAAVIWLAVFAVILLTGDAVKIIYLFLACIFIWVFMCVPTLFLGLPRFDQIINRLFTMVYALSILGAFIAVVVLFARSPLFLLSVMMIVWVADIGAYFVGRQFGRRKLAPTISPGKSWEGVLGGYIFVLLVALSSTCLPALYDTLFVRLWHGVGMVQAILCLTVLVAASVVGDLFESSLKRRADVKDSSNLLPGHGGVLDRIDALIPVLPIAALMSIVLLSSVGY